MLWAHMAVISYLSYINFFEDVTNAVSPVDTLDIVLFLAKHKLKSPFFKWVCDALQILHMQNQYLDNADTDFV